MDENEWLVDQFEAHRPHLQGVAYRMVGSLSEAEDAVQETWLRFSRSDTSDVANLRGWLTTVVARLCLDMLRSRKSRREQPLGEEEVAPIQNRGGGLDPEQEAQLADSVGLALLVVLETLSPAERLAFVLHDVFAVPFDEIAPIVGRSTAAARKLASRARLRVQGADTVFDADLSRQREIVGAFLAAARGGDFEALLAVLDPDVLLRADLAAVPPGAPSEVRGAAAVARNALAARRRARFAQLGLVDGAVGIIMAPQGRLFLVMAFTIAHGKIVAIDVIANPERLQRLDLAVLAD